MKLHTLGQAIIGASGTVATMVLLSGESTGNVTGAIIFGGIGLGGFLTAYGDLRENGNERKTF
jgi:hypothetical protein